MHEKYEETRRATPSVQPGCEMPEPTHAPQVKAEAGDRDAVAVIPDATIIVIEKRTLVRECLVCCLQVASGHTVLSFPNVDRWLEVRCNIRASLIVLCTAATPNDAETRRDISRVVHDCRAAPTIILGDGEEPDQIVDALERGARGYVPTSLPLDIVVGAMRLVIAGGVFIPASSLVAARQSDDGCSASPHDEHDVFTARQAAVVDALRRGKANKIIAYELNMRESTVKVHVRTIMKKLKARNRTEVAFMASRLMRSQDGNAV